MALGNNNSHVQKRYTYLILLVLLLGALISTVFVCVNTYQDARQEYMDKEDLLLVGDVRNVQMKILAWRDSLFYQTNSLSSSTLYRLFAQDSLPSASSKDIDTEQTVRTDMTEQAPLLRAMLRDFMKNSGFKQGRMVSFDGQVLLSVTPNMLPLRETQLMAVRQAIETNDIAFGSAYLVANEPVQDFAIPLQPMLGDNENKPAAALLFYVSLNDTIRKVTSDSKGIPLQSPLYILQRSNSGFEAVESNDIHYLPQATAVLEENTTENILPLGRRTSVHGKEDVFSRGIQIQNIGWWIVTEIPESVYDETLGSIAQRIILVGSVVGIAFLLCLTFIWWLAIGRNQHQTAQRFEELYHTVRQQNILLNSINVALEDGLFMVDTKGEILLCNQAFANIVHIQTKEEVVDKKLYMLFNGEGGNKLLAGITTVLREGDSSRFEIAVEEEDKTLHYRVTLCICEDSKSSKTMGVVGTMYDITEFLNRALANQRMQENITNALVRAIESIDPYLSGHSSMMQSLGALMVTQIGLDNNAAKTIDIATRLSQIGKLCLPKELLFKTGKLTDEERIQLQQIPIFAYDILSDVQFDLPIAEAVYAMSEKMDGSGYPLGLEGKDISIHARILSVLHTFCAILSARAWRKGMDMNKTLEILRSSSDFDQEIVTSLETILKTKAAADILQERNTPKSHS